MRLALTIGTVTLVEPHPAMRGGPLRVITPLGPDDLAGVAAGRLAATALATEPLVAWDDLGCGDGQLVAFSEGGEAAQPFDPLDKPVDAYVAAIIDRLEID
jgi:microcompartment protein CcmK/EutM